MIDGGQCRVHDCGRGEVVERMSCLANVTCDNIVRGPKVGNVCWCVEDGDLGMTCGTRVQGVTVGIGGVRSIVC